MIAGRVFIGARATVVAALLVLAPTGAGATSACARFILDSTPVRGHSQVLADVTAVPGTTTAWAVGFFHDNTLFSDRTLTEFWDGTAWSQIKSPSIGRTDDNYLLGVVPISAADVWAVGYRVTNTGEKNLIEHWDGTAWTVVPSPDRATYNSLHAVTALSSGDVWAVGHWLNTNHNPIRQQTLAEHWDGSSWAIVPTPNVGSREDNELVSVSNIPGTAQVMAVGYHQGQNAFPLVEAWDGLGWTIGAAPETPERGGYLNSVAAIGADDIWSVGFVDDAHGLFHALTAHWDGGAWAVVPSPQPGGFGSNPMLNGVDALATNDVWAVGTYYSDGSALLTLAEHWDGSAWRVASTQNPGGTTEFAANVFDAVAATSSTDVRAVGYWHLPDIYADPPHALAESCE